MKIISSLTFLQKEVARLRKSGKVIGFIPTMGYFHEGHLSLIRQARWDCDIVIVSIFVNPFQFGPHENLKEYPRDINRDISLCRRYADILFLPKAHIMYADDFLTSIEVNKMSSVLCGASRPGHFKGVTTVVNKFFNIVTPNIAYFGQKDAQQAIIIKRMVKDLNMPIEIEVLPIVREYDGLAMSSRNIYLSVKKRKDAVVLYQSLMFARELTKKGMINCREIISRMKKLIRKTKSAKIDYISIVDSKTLLPLKSIKREALVLLAVFIGKTRLIDNMILRRK